jgi:putative acetyltransferase
MKFDIRDETPADIPAIFSLTRDAFLRAAHTSHTEQFIVEGLRNAGALELSLVAELDRTLVGHVAVSPVSLSDGTEDWFGIGPISVAPAQQRRGIGSRLMREALRVMSAAGAGGCVVLGEPGYYKRFGFRAEPALVLAGVPPQYFQALHFRSSRPRGDVRYHTAFDA